MKGCKDCEHNTDNLQVAKVLLEMMQHDKWKKRLEVVAIDYLTQSKGSNFEREKINVRNK